MGFSRFPIPNPDPVDLGSGFFYFGLDRKIPKKSRSGNPENLGIPGIGIYFFGIYFFGIFIPRIFSKSPGFSQNLRDFLKTPGIRDFFSWDGISRQKANSGFRARFASSLIGLRELSPITARSKIEINLWKKIRENRANIGLTRKTEPDDCQPDPDRPDDFESGPNAHPW